MPRKTGGEKERERKGRKERETQCKIRVRQQKLTGGRASELGFEAEEVLRMPRSRQQNHLLLLLLQRDRLLLLPRFYFLLILFSLPSLVPANQQVTALYQWINSSAAAAAALPDWNPAHATPCKWSHVTCNAAGSVSAVAIQSLPLAISLPAGICAALPSLAAFVVSDANLTGAIPPDLADCSLLAVLDLSSNSLSGGIPAASPGSLPSPRSYSTPISSLVPSRMTSELQQSSVTS